MHNIRFSNGGWQGWIPLEGLDGSGTLERNGRDRQPARRLLPGLRQTTRTTSTPPTRTPEISTAAGADGPWCPAPTRWSPQPDSAPSPRFRRRPGHGPSAARRNPVGGSGGQPGTNSRSLSRTGPGFTEPVRSRRLIRQRSSSGRGSERSGRTMSAPRPARSSIAVRPVATSAQWTPTARAQARSRGVSPTIQTSPRSGCQPAADRRSMATWATAARLAALSPNPPRSSSIGGIRPPASSLCRAMAARLPVTTVCRTPAAASRASSESTPANVLVCARSSSSRSKTRRRNASSTSATWAISAPTAARSISAISVSSRPP